MALNDAYPFVDGINRWKAEHDFNSTDVVKCAIITDAYTPTASDVHPCWGAGGTTNLSTYEVAAGGNYTAGGKTCANAAASFVGGYTQLDFDNPTAWEADGSNPTNARWAIFYNFTATNKECLGYYDLGAVFDMSSGELVITVGAPFARVQ